MKWLDAFYQSGAKMFDESGNVTLNSPEGVEATQFLVDLANKDKVCPPEFLEIMCIQAHEYFLAGKVAMCINWPYMIPMVEDPTMSKVVGKVDVTLQPQHRRRAHIIEPWAIAVNAYSSHFNETVEFLKYTFGPDPLYYFGKNIELIPPRISVMEQLEKDNVPYTKVAAEAVTKYGQVKEHGLKVKAWEIEEMLTDMNQNALSQRMTAKEALDDAAEKLKQLV